jgi:hypothetical protein
MAVPIANRRMRKMIGIRFYPTVSRHTLTRQSKQQPASVLVASISYCRKLPRHLGGQAGIALLSA